MALLNDLFGIAGPTPQSMPDDDDLLRRANRLNDGLVTSQALAPQIAGAPIVPPLQERTVQEYPVAEAAPMASPVTTGSTPRPEPTSFTPREASWRDRLRHIGLALQGKDPGNLDRKIETENMTVQWLTNRGMSPEQATIVARDPKLTQAALVSAMGPKQGVREVGPGTALVNERGEVVFRNEQARPGFHNVAPGATVLDAEGRPVFQAPMSANEAKPPSGYEWIDPNDRSKGVAAIPGGPATKGTGEMAGKIALMRTARDAIRDTRGVLEKPWGVSGSVQSGLSDAFPAFSGDIGEAQRNVRAGIEAALRIMTGAAAPETEVVRYMNLFMPNSRDDEKSAKQKLNLLESFMDQAEAFARQGHQTRDEMADDPTTWGQRPDGTQKGAGFLGPLRRSDGGVSTEITIGVPIRGKEMDIPTLVPGLTRDEVQYLLNDGSLQRGNPTADAIIRKAIQHAEMRLNQGKSVFAEPGEQGGPSASRGAGSDPLGIR